MDHKAPEILLVEDNPGDVLLTRIALQRVCPMHNLHVAKDGIDALQALLGNPSGQNPSRPDLVILDLNLPRMNGQELIARLQDFPDLMSIPLVILTSSRHDQSLLDSWRPGPCFYLVKPQTFAELCDLLQHVTEAVGSCRG